MSMPAHAVVSAGGALARKRLAGYARYAELVAEQEAALEADDLGRFEELQAAVSELQAGLGLTASLSVGADDAGVDNEAFVQRAIQILRSTLERNERIQARLRLMRNETGNDIRNLSEGRHGARTYLGRDSAEARGPNLDMKL